MRRKKENRRYRLDVETPEERRARLDANAAAARRRRAQESLNSEETASMPTLMSCELEDDSIIMTNEEPVWMLIMRPHRPQGLAKLGSQPIAAKKHFEMLRECHEEFCERKNPQVLEAMWNLEMWTSSVGIVAHPASLLKEKLEVQSRI